MRTIKKLNASQLPTEYILYGVPIGQPKYMETVITTTTNPEHSEYFQTAKEWAAAKGFDRFRESVCDFSEPLNFTQAINL